MHQTSVTSDKSSARDWRIQQIIKVSQTLQFQTTIVFKEIN